jgi:hypothetical protein
MYAPAYADNGYCTVGKYDGGNIGDGGHQWTMNLQEVKLVKLISRITSGGDQRSAVTPPERHVRERRYCNCNGDSIARF